MQHCVILKKKLFTTGSRNSKGVKLVVFNHALEQEWLKASVEEQRAMFKPGSDYYTRVYAQTMYAIGGDHTRSAVTELHEDFPAQEKWAMFKGVTILISGESVECCSMLRDLGVMYNSKQYHKDMGFADRMMLTRRYYADMGMLDKGKRRTEEVIAWCEKQCALAGIPTNSWSQYAACARVDAESWVFMEAILKGQYASKIGRGAMPGTVPSSQSPFIQIMTCPPDIIKYHLEQVYNGKLSITGLRIAAENYKAFALAKEMIIWTVERAVMQGATEELVGKTYPVDFPELRCEPRTRPEGIDRQKQEDDENRLPTLVERESVRPLAGENPGHNSMCHKLYYCIFLVEGSKRK